MLVIPATQEAEAEDHLNPGGRGHSEPRLCHCTSARAMEGYSISLKKKKRKEKKRKEKKENDVYPHCL